MWKRIEFTIVWAIQLQYIQILYHWPFTIHKLFKSSQKCTICPLQTKHGIVNNIVLTEFDLSSKIHLFLIITVGGHYEKGRQSGDGLNLQRSHDQTQKTGETWLRRCTPPCTVLKLCSINEQTIHLYWVDPFWLQ